jgi:hypothetical protein
MADEFQALVDNDTWRLVSRPPGVNVATGRWLWKLKYNADGTLPSIRLVGLLEDLIRSLVLIMMRLSVRGLNRVRFGLC